MFGSRIQYRQLCRIIPRNYSTVVSAQYQRIDLNPVPLHEFVWRNVEKYPTKTAAVCLETQKSYTYEQLYKKTYALTSFLKEGIKLQPQETVAVILPNLIEYPIIVLGAAQAGLRITTCNPNYTSEEIQRQLTNSNARLVFTTSELLPLVQNTNLPIIEVGNRDFGTTGAISFDEIISKEPYSNKKIKINTSDTLFLPYSSGTTGLPKGVELTHFNIVSNLRQMSTGEFNLLPENTDQHEIPAFLPFFHIYGLAVVLLNTLAHGGKLITVPKFNGDKFLELLRKHKPTIIFGVPLVVQLATNNAKITAEDLESIQALISGAAPLSASDVERFTKKTNNKTNLMQAYGMTETSPITLMQSKKLPNGYKIGGSGIVAPHTELKIINPDGSSLDGLGPNQSGELLVKGPQVMKGYYKNPKATAETFTEDGWLKTGDIAHYDEGEHFFITDRLKELIKVKGFQVAPAELEAILRDHPDVEDAAVVGVNHDTLGEAPKAFVVIRNGRNVKESQIAEFIKSQVSKHKHLTGGVVFVDSIPKNPSGKILRRELKKL